MKLVKKDKKKTLYIRFFDPKTDEEAFFNHEILNRWTTSLTNGFYNWALKLMPHMSDVKQDVKFQRDDGGEWFVIETNKNIVSVRSNRANLDHKEILDKLTGLLLNNEHFMVFLGLPIVLESPFSSYKYCSMKSKN